LALTLSSIHERLLSLRSSLGDHVSEIVLLSLERVEKLSLEVSNDRLVKVLDVTEEDGREGGVEVGDEVGSLPLVDSSVVSRRVSIEVSWKQRTKRERRAQRPWSVECLDFSTMQDMIEELTQSQSFPLSQHPSQTLENLTRLDWSLDSLEIREESIDGDRSNLVASELSEKLLLSRDIEVGIGLDLFLFEWMGRNQRTKTRQFVNSVGNCENKERKTNPDSLHVESNSIGRDPLVVGRLEDEVLPRSVNESLPEILDGVLELFRHEDLVRESSES